MKRILWTVFFFVLTFANVGSADTIQTWLGTGLSPLTTSLYPERDTGANWKLIASGSQIPWPKKQNFRAVSYNGYIWLAGGETNSEIWKSVDGINWTQVSTNKLPANLQRFGFTVFKNKMWVVNGITTIGLGPTNKVYSSEDGINWTVATTSAVIFATSNSSVAFATDDYLWFINTGGNGYVWRSLDGIDWICVTTTTPFTNTNLKYRHCIGASLGNSFILGQYATNDGINWREFDATEGNDTSVVAFAVSYNDKFYFSRATSGIPIWYTDETFAVKSIATTSNFCIYNTPWAYEIIGQCGVTHKGHMYWINSNPSTGLKSIYRSY